MRVFTIRVLFIESDHRFIFGLPLGFKDAGHTIQISGPLDQCNLDQLLIDFKPDIAILMGWSNLHTNENLDYIREILQKYLVPSIYWATEDPTFIDLFSIPLIKRLCPCYVFTVSERKVDTYITLGYPACYLPFGYQPSIFKPIPTSATTNYSLSLVANAYPNVLQYDPSHHRQKSLGLLLNPLLEQNVQVDLWGLHWNNMQPYLTYAIPTSWQHGPVHYLKTNDIYNKSKIILGLQNYEEDVLAMRTFEILGSGGFMITSYHTRLKEYFNPGKDFIMVETEDIILDYMNYYLKHPQERTKIQINGMKSALQHSYQLRALEVVKHLKDSHIIPSNL